MSEHDPLELFRRWFLEAEQAIPKDPNAMALATVDDDGRPAVRIVLLKGFDARGFVFYTNLESRKGRELLAHPGAALCFYWPVLDRQVRVEGSVSLVDDLEADAYFATRARLSQVGAWASQQSRPLASREELEARVVEIEQRYAHGPVPRPPHWSGFRLRPARIEFWHARANRLHERQVFSRHDSGWSHERLYP